MPRTFALRQVRLSTRRARSCTAGLGQGGLDGARKAARGPIRPIRRAASASGRRDRLPAPRAVKLSGCRLCPAPTGCGRDARLPGQITTGPVPPLRERGPLQRWSQVSEMPLGRRCGRAQLTCSDPGRSGIGSSRGAPPERSLQPGLSHDPDCTKVIGWSFCVQTHPPSAPQGSPVVPARSSAR